MLELKGESTPAVSGSQLGNIVGLAGTTSEMDSALQAYQKESELSQKELESNLESGKLGRTAAYMRQKQVLTKQYEQLMVRKQEADTIHSEVKEQMSALDEELEPLKEYVDKLNSQLKKRQNMEETAVKKTELGQLQSLMTLNDSLHKKESEYKSSCKAKLVELKTKVKELEEELKDVNNEDNQKFEEIQEMHRKVMVTFVYLL